LITDEEIAAAARVPIPPHQASGYQFTEIAASSTNVADAKTVIGVDLMIQPNKAVVVVDHLRNELRYR